MQEFKELQKRGGKFYSKCIKILEKAEQMHQRLRPKVNSLGNFETRTEEDQRMQRERGYLTYNHQFDKKERTEGDHKDKNQKYEYKENNI
jgi:hypothetical protein